MAKADFKKAIDRYGAFLQASGADSTLQFWGEDGNERVLIQYHETLHPGATTDYINTVMP